MALGIQTTRVALSTGTGTQDITITGFGTPKAALVVVSRGSSSDDWGNGGYLGVGFTDGTRENHAGCHVEHGVATSETARWHSDRSIIAVANETTGDTSLDGEASFNSWITDGMRINLDNIFSEGWYAHVTFFGGSDIDSVYAGIHDDLGTSTSPVNVTAPGFQADLVFTAGIGIASALSNQTAVGAAGIIHFGSWIRDGVDTQMGIAFSSLDAASTTVANSIVETDSNPGQIYNDAQTWTIALSSNASGFTATPSASSGSDLLHYLAIKWATTPNIDIIEVTLPTSGDYTESGLSFQPDWALLGMSDLTTSDSLGTTGQQSMTVITLESGQVVSVGIAESDGETTTSEVASYSKAEFFIGDSDGSTTKDAGALTSINSDGWTIGLNAGTNDGTARKGWALAIQTEPHISSVSSDDVIGGTENPWNIAGSGFGDQ